MMQRRSDKVKQRDTERAKQADVAAEPNLIAVQGTRATSCKPTHPGELHTVWMAGASCPGKMLYSKVKKKWRLFSYSFQATAAACGWGATAERMSLAASLQSWKWAER